MVRFLVALTVFGGGTRALADEAPFIDYKAPRECPSEAVFNALVAGQIARNPNRDRPWRFVVRIEHGDGFDGTVTTGLAHHALHGSACLDVAVGLAAIIARARPAKPLSVSTGPL